MIAGIYDTNLLYVANRLHDATPECIQACNSALNEAQTKIIVIDDSFEILREYQKKISPKHGKGVGSEFLMHLLRNRTNSDRVELVKVLPHEDRGYVEFPDDIYLKSFDPKDRIFAAVAIASIYNPPLFVSVESDWWKNREVFHRHGIEFQFLCERENENKLERDSRKSIKRK